MATELHIERDGDCWTFTLHRPEKMNALSANLVEELIDAVAQAHDGNARVLVFRGDGKNLSAGFDFGNLDEQSEGDLLLRFVRIETLLQTIDSSPCLTVGFAHGKNFGAGVDLLASCKRRYCTPDALFRMPGLAFGLVLGTRRFGARVGRETAREILEATRAFHAPEAASIGFVQKVIDPADLDDIIATAVRDSAVLDDASRRRLYRVLATEHADEDLAALVRSAAQPGLKARIRAYLAPRASAAVDAGAGNRTQASA